jgi:hypothetical protein
MREFPADKKLDKTALSIGKLSEDSDERQFWLAQKPEARLEALELVRQVLYGYNTTSRLQRVFEVVRRTQH